jgi:CDP-glycerol glycerophosphotransferase
MEVLQRRCQLALHFVFYYLLPKKKNTILFYTFQGKFTCNPKYITEELLMQNHKYQIIWCLDDERELCSLKNQYKEIRFIKRGGIKFYKALVQSHLIVKNANYIFPPTFFLARKRPHQIIIQTWHGSLGIKQIKLPPKEWADAVQDGKYTNYIISNSSFETNVYRNTFWTNTKVLEYGHPRNDILINHTEESVQQLTDDFLRRYNLPSDCKLCMYAPTFRENDVTDLYYCVDYNLIASALSSRFGGKWLILMKLHSKTKIPSHLSESCCNISDYPDIQELMLIVDAGITDYSSWICDYVFTRKPGFIFAPDIADYDEERGFYYPLSETPFPVAYSNNELQNNILQFDDKNYQTEIARFLKAKGCIEDGRASKRVVELITTLIK